MREIKLSQVENLSNLAFTKSGECAALERILRRIKLGGKGRFPTYFYKDQKVVVDISKDDIEGIGYCDRCMIYAKEDECTDSCPKCGNDVSFCEGLKLKDKKYYLYGDGEVSKDYIDKYGNEIVEYKRTVPHK